MEEVRMHVQGKPAPRPLFSITLDDYLSLLYMQTNYIAVIYSSFTLQKHCPKCGAPMYKEYLFRKSLKGFAYKPECYHFVCLRCGYEEKVFYKVKDAP